MSLEPDAIRRVAKLARLHVPAEHEAALASELSGILGWIEQLDAVDVTGIDPLTGAAQMALRLRPDVVTDGGITPAVLSNAPDRGPGPDGPYYAVPKVVE